MCICVNVNECVCLCKRISIFFILMFSLSLFPLFPSHFQSRQATVSVDAMLEVLQRANEEKVRR